LPGERFIGRFLQHVLPKGFVKVRYFGLFSPSRRAVLAEVRALLGVRMSEAAEGTGEVQGTFVANDQQERVRCCPVCGAVMELTLELMPASRSPP
jgi:hypothetical protein